MDEGDLRSVIDRARDALDDDPEMSARATDLRVVLPLLKALGWEIHGPEVAVEYAVDPGAADGPDAGEGPGDDAGTGGGSTDGEAGGPGERSGNGESPDPDGIEVDYALLAEGDPAAFVETAADDDDVAAAADRVEAAMTAAGVDLGLATDGGSYVFLARRTDGVERAATTLADLAADASPLSHYTRQAAERRRRRHRRERRRGVADDLSDGREAAAADVATALTDEAGTDLDGELAAAGEAFVERVVDALSTGDHPGTAVAGTGRGDDADGTAGDADPAGGAGDDDRERSRGTGEGGPASGDPTGDSGPAGSTAGVDAADTQGADAGGGPNGATGSDRTGEAGTTGASDAATGREAGGDGRTADGEAADAGEEGEYVVRFFDDRASVGAVGHATPGGAMAQAVDYLIERHALGNRLRVPWGPDDADGRAIVSREPVHPDGTEMSAAAELSDGYYLYTDLPTPASRRVVERLAGKAGLRVMFQGDWADREA